MALEGSIAFFCSNRCPGDIILKAQDWANARGPGSTAIISGFHTSVERDVLRILLRQHAPVIYCLAKGTAGFRRSAVIRNAESAGRAAFISPFPENQRRTTAATAAARNRFILRQCKSVLIGHASASGKTEALAKEAAALGIELVTFDSLSNRNLVALGAKLL